MTQFLAGVHAYNALHARKVAVFPPHQNWCEVHDLPIWRFEQFAGNESCDWYCRVCDLIDGRVDGEGVLRHAPDTSWCSNLNVANSWRFDLREGESVAWAWADEEGNPSHINAWDEGAQGDIERILRERRPRAIIEDCDFIGSRRNFGALEDTRTRLARSVIGPAGWGDGRAADFAVGHTSRDIPAFNESREHKPNVKPFTGWVQVVVEGKSVRGSMHYTDGVLDGGADYAGGAA